MLLVVDIVFALVVSGALADASHKIMMPGRSANTEYPSASAARSSLASASPRLNDVTDGTVWPAPVYQVRAYLCFVCMCVCLHTGCKVSAVSPPERSRYRLTRSRHSLVSARPCTCTHCFVIVPMSSIWHRI